MTQHDIQHHFELALQHHQAGRLQEAELGYRRVLASEPGHADAMHNLGVAAAQVGGKDTAVELFVRAIALKPNFPSAHRNLGNALRDKGQLDEAIAAYHRAISLNPSFPEAHYDLGGVLKSSGQVDEAIAAYRQAIAFQSDFPEAWCDLGSALKDTGQLDQAIAAYRQAVALRPNYPEAHSNLGNALTEKGQLDEAIAACRQAIAFRPNHFGPYYNLGLALQRKDRLDEAIAAYRQAIDLEPNFPESHCNLGNALQEIGQLDEAVAAYRQAVALKPNFAEAYSNLGSALRDIGQFDEAIAAFHQAIALKPNFPEAHCNLGNTLKDIGQLDEAIAAFRQAIALNPGFPEAHCNLAGALRDVWQRDEAVDAYRLTKPAVEKTFNLALRRHEAGRLQEAEQLYRQVLAREPNHVEALHNLGAHAIQTGRNDLAEELISRAIALRPMFPEAFGNLGNALINKGQPDDAITAYRRAIALGSTDPEVHWNLGLTLLAKGDFRGGWEEYEWRWERNVFKSVRRDFAQPRWDGGQLEGRTLLLHAEQGIGDTLHFIRYLPLAAQRGGKIIIECQPELRRLLQGMAWECQVVAKGQPLPAFDLHCPLLSLPSIFGTTLDSLANVAPYLQADAERAQTWQHRLAGHSQVVKVGLAWAGRPAHMDDHNRSMRLAWLEPLARAGGVRFFSLQKGDAAAQAMVAPPGMVLVDWTEELKDFADTAALIANLDLVIAVDTAVAHLAGAMGKPVWTMLPLLSDWRWLLEREDSPWYPSMRLFRQTSRGDWDSVINRIADALYLFTQPAGQQAVDLPSQRLGQLPPSIADSPAPDAAEHPSDSSQAEVGNDFALALQHHQSGRLQEAEQLYWQVLAKEPNHADALHNLGVHAHQTGRPDLADQLIRRAIEVRPNFPQAIGNLANTLRGQGKIDEAIAAYRQAIALQPDFPDAHYQLGTVVKKNRQLDEAIAAYRQAIALKPDFAEAYCDLGNALKENGQLDDAIAAYRQAIAIRPEYAEAHNNLGNALTDKGRFDVAIAACSKAISIKPTLFGPHYNLGNALQRQEQFDEAIAAYRQAIALEPDFPDTHCNLGNAFKETGRLDDAIACYRHALTLKANHAESHWNLALALLLRGEFQQGWEEYEWRWKLKCFPSPLREFPQPLWDGRPLMGATLLLHAEQGFGDAIQFIRYLPLAAKCAGTIVVECRAELHRLIQAIAGERQIVIKGQPLPAFDYHCPLLSLPRALGTTLDNLPNKVPYLQADANDVERWRQRLAGHCQVVKVGLVWAGRPAHGDDHNRSIKLASLQPLARVPGVRFFSLQKGEAAAEAKSRPPGMDIVDWTDELNDFADTAALIVNLDLVIAVDTAAAHLAGALGKPVWTLVTRAPDWRWLLEREDSPWYPSMRLFRQTSRGDWDSVINRVAEALSLWISGGVGVQESALPSRAA